MNGAAVSRVAEEKDFKIAIFAILVDSGFGKVCSGVSFYI